MSRDTEIKKTILGIPVLPLRDIVVFPGMVVPLFVGRDRSVKALELAMAADKQILVVTQRTPSDELPTEEGVYKIGMLATVLQLLKLPDGTVKVLIEGIERTHIAHLIDREAYVLADVEVAEEVPGESREVEILARSLKSQFEQYARLNRKIPTELLNALLATEEPGRLADMIASQVSVKLDEKQKILELLNVTDRLEKLLAVMESEIDLLQIERKIRGRVKRQMGKSQREYYLNEQMKAIQKELETEGGHNELADLEKRIKESTMTDEARKKCTTELGKLKLMPAMSAEATVSRNYLDWVLSLPWKNSGTLRETLGEAEKILEDEHYGLKEVKERIIEYLAVQQRVKKLKGPILCLVGPPGVGKTSLGQSIANATGRQFIRMSLGGVRDEAEIRGHRRTYIGAMPGKILQKLSKVDTNNPFFLLDEIDKMSSDFRGDPASALLEVLDPEQNHAFSDHYLEVDYDLSDVMFVATANTLDIPPALLDRMEVIRIPGYTEDEKIHIALRHLIPKQMLANGLLPSEVDLNFDVVQYIVQYYTREAGVRHLEREIAKVFRKIVKEILLATKGKKDKKQNKRVLKIAELERYLGVRRFRHDSADEKDQVGQVKGLAWTEVGGELLSIEAVTLPGKGKILHTGRLGDVMKESIQAALSVVRSRAKLFGIPKNFFEAHDIHIHVPEGATPKDGPSAGIGMCTALVSVLTGIPVRADCAMTGEITLRGEVLPIGGLKEKLLAAHRGAIKTVIIPHENEQDLKDIPDNIKKALTIKTVRWIDDVFAIALKGYPNLLPLKAKRLRATKAGKIAIANRKVRGERVRVH